jgi:hypothetical protein
MRADYVDKFRSQWTGGLQRLVQQGAWFRDAAYPYAASETCVGHSTISTGAFPTSHGMVANAWWDRASQSMVTCTSDPKAKNSGYAGFTAKGGDSAWRMLIPSFAEELKFQTGGATRIVTFSLKARASITMAGHKADAATPCAANPQAMSRTTLSTSSGLPARSPITTSPSWPRPPSIRLAWASPAVSIFSALATPPSTTSATPSVPAAVRSRTS